jgi:hypothetical protein
MKKFFGVKQFHFFTLEIIYFSVMGSVLLFLCLTPNLSFVIKLSLVALFVFGAFVAKGNIFENLLYVFFLAMALPATLFYIPLAKEYTAPFSLNDFLILPIFLALICYKFLKKDFKTYKIPLFIPLLFLFIVALISLFNAQDKRIGIIYLSFMLEGFIIYICMLDFFHTEKKLRNLLFILFIIAFFYGIYGIFQYKFGKIPLIEGTEIQKSIAGTISRVRANLTHPNCLSGFIAVVLPLMYASFEKNRKLWNLWLVVSIIILIFTLGVTYSRNGYIAFLMGSFTTIIFYSIRNKKLGWFLFFIIGLILLYIIINNFFPHVLKRFISIKYFSTDLSALQRLIFWEEGAKTFLSHPLFGTGIANFVYQPYSNGYLIAHNLFVTTIVSMGLMGIFGLLFLFWRITNLLFVTYKTANSNFQVKLSIGFLSAWVAFIFHNLFDEVWTAPSYTPEMKHLWFLLGITILFVRLSNNKNAEIYKGH